VGWSIDSWTRYYAGRIRKISPYLYAGWVSSIYFLHTKCIPIRNR